MPWDISESRKNKRRVVGETTVSQTGLQWEASGLVWRGFCREAPHAPLWRHCGAILSGRRF